MIRGGGQGRDEIAHCLMSLGFRARMDNKQNQLATVALGQLRTLNQKLPHHSPITLTPNAYMIYSYSH